MDGGDVLVVGRHVFVGRSGRTNDDGIAQMSAALLEYGYQVTPVDVRGCLHLKSAVTALAENVLLVNPAWLPLDAFATFDRVSVHPGEPWGANALLVGDHVIYATSFPRTLDAIVRRGIRVRTVEATEVAKAEGAVTCCSLIVESVPNEHVIPSKP
jgi:dimethylargininase